MGKAPHIIEQQFLEVTFTDRREGMGLQDQLATIYKEKVLPLLESVLNDHDLPDYTLQIDEITIDAGVLSSQNWEQELVERSVQQFKSILQKKLLSPWPKKAINHPTPPPTEEGARWMPEGSFHYERFIQFLSTGTMPVSDSRHTIQQTMALLLSHKDDWQTVANRKALLQHLLSDQQALERLIRQGGDIVEEIMQWLHERPLRDEPFYAPLAAITSLYNKRLWLSSLVLIQKAQEQSIILEHLQKTAPIRLLQSLVVHSQEGIAIQEWMETLGPQAANLLKGSIEPTFPAIKKEEIAKEDTASIEKEKVRAGEDKDRADDDKARQEGTAFHIYNAGLIILHPFLLPFFLKTGLLDQEQQWLNKAAQQRAVLLSQYLVTGEEKIPEFFLPLNKLLCGYPQAATLDDHLELTTQDKKEATALLSSVIEHWGALKNTGIEALQASFLQRAGKLTRTEKGWQLLAEQKSFDILMQSIPWAIGRIKTPWMQEWLLTDWT